MSLKEIYTEYGDGRKETKLIHLKEGEVYISYAQRDNIIFEWHKSFKYMVDKHPYLSKSLVELKGVKYIMPQRIEVHPNTTLDDILEIEKRVNKPSTKHTWKFKSSKGDVDYKVTLNFNKLYCDCPGFYRAKDRKCKHIKEVETTQYL